jgi:hypothetical protein
VISVKEVTAMTPDPLRDIASQLDELRTEQQARAADKKRENQRDIGLHTLSVLLVIICVLIVGLLRIVAEGHWTSP